MLTNQDFNHRYQRSWRSPQPDVPFRRKPPFADPYYVEEMQRLGYTTLGVRIKAVGVFDTVGSLGIPRIGWLGALGQQISSRLSDYTFYDTMLNDRYENAFQALALDEKRASFQPCVWEKPDRSRTNLVCSIRACRVLEVIADPTRSKYGFQAYILM